jgi:hypothetical protein
MFTGEKFEHISPVSSHDALFSTDLGLNSFIGGRVLLRSLVVTANSWTVSVKWCTVASFQILSNSSASNFSVQ